MKDAFGEEDDSSHSTKKHHSKDKDKGKKQKVMELIEKAEKEGIELPPAVTDNVSQEQIQSMLAETMKQIETRKKKVQEAVRNLYCLIKTNNILVEIYWERNVEVFIWSKT